MKDCFQILSYSVCMMRSSWGSWVWICQTIYLLDYMEESCTCDIFVCVAVCLLVYSELVKGFLSTYIAYFSLIDAYCYIITSLLHCSADLLFALKQTRGTTKHPLHVWLSKWRLQPHWIKLNKLFVGNNYSEIL